VNFISWPLVSCNITSSVIKTPKNTAEQKIMMTLNQHMRRNLHELLLWSVLQLKYSSSKTITSKNFGQYRLFDNLEYLIIHQLSVPMLPRLMEFYCIFCIALNLQFINTKYWQLWKIISNNTSYQKHNITANMNSFSYIHFFWLHNEYELLK